MYKIFLVCLVVIVFYSCRNKKSDEILEKFNEIEKSLNKSGDNIGNKNKDILNAFEKDFNKRGNKVGPYRLRALMADSITKSFLKYVDSLIVEVEKGAGGRNVNGVLKNDDDIEHHAILFINERKGAELKLKINQTRGKLLDLVDWDDKGLINSDLIAKDNPKTGLTWESELFEHSPAAAVVTLLTKIKNDAKNTEAQVLERLALAIDKKDCFFRLQDPAYRDSIRVLLIYYDSIQGTK